MKRILIICLSLAALFSIACDPVEIIGNTVGLESVVGSGVMITEERTLPDFDSVELSGSMSAEITRGDSVKCVVEGEDNVVPRLKTEVIGNKLKIYFERGFSISIHKELNVYLEVPEISKVAVTGSGDIDFIDVTGAELKAVIDGSGDITGVGETEILDAEINGSGDMKLFELYAKEASVEINGSGDVGINVSDSLDAEINGSGDIKYKGNPENVKRSINGSGDVRKVE